LYPFRYMKVCKSCGVSIPCRSVVEGRVVHLQNRRYCLQCSPFKKGGKGFHGDKTTEEGLRVCPCCKDNLPTGAFYKRTRPGGGFSVWCKSCQRVEDVERQRRFKAKCVDYKGGSCTRCGYSKYVGALEFHHRDPNTKDLAMAQARSQPWREVIAELDKCDLLCANCHREAHAELQGILPLLVQADPLASASEAD